MENRAHAIAVGLFTLFLILASIFAYWWLGGSRQQLASYTVVSPLPVTGLSVESSVKFRGVDVGKVTGMAFDPASQTSILISIVVPESLQLTKEAYAELRMQGITGLSYIDLNDESKSSPKLAAGSNIPLRPSFVDHLLSNGPQLISQLEVLITNTSKLTETANRLIAGLDGQKLNRTLDNLDKASAKVEPVLDSASIMFTHVGQLASEVNQKQLLQTLESLQQTSDSARPVLSELNETAREFRNIAGRVETNSGQILDTLDNETLPQLHLLSQNMNHDLRHFDYLIDLLEDNPQSLVFGMPAPQPGPGEPGFK
ncbi:MAG TPA: MlaD family protein [Methylophilaceae bacterium]|jgi:phospholipid/cholesterol/gamma-HCH transport system substrate-binding protein